jgi:hypothetical protein
MKDLNLFKSLATKKKGILLAILLVIAIVGVFLTTKETDKYGVAKAGLPPLRGVKEDVYDYYKLRFLPDGYPGKQVGSKIVPHPIYGAYVISDYLAQYHSTKNEKYLQAAVKVAKSSIARMEEFRGALVFWYDPGIGLSSLPTKFYSGLTQSRYLILLGKLFELTGDPLFLESSKKILQSLFIKRGDGGVLKQLPSGVSIEEHPHEIPLYTLNGWLTAMINLKQYADMANSARAKELFAKNVDSVERIIDLYDVEEVANSRYHLSGRIPLKLRFLNGFKPKIILASVNIPQEGEFPIGFHQQKSPWCNFIKDKKHVDHNFYLVTGEEIEINIVLSMISFPDENSVSFELETSTGGEIEVLIGDGDYDVLLSGVRPTRWISLGRFHVAQNAPKIQVAIPWRKAWLVAYPNHFGKKIGGKYYNVYHYIHIAQMKTLYDYTKKEKFKKYYLKWLGYTKRWPEMDPYKSQKIEFQPYHQRSS